MRFPTILTSCFLAVISFPLMSVAEDTEQDAALLEDYENVLSIVEGDLGLDASSVDGEAVVSDLMGKVCANQKPVVIPIPFLGFIKLCPPPEIPCSRGKVCWVTRRGNGCSCKAIKKNKVAHGAALESDVDEQSEIPESEDCGVE